MDLDPRLHFVTATCIVAKKDPPIGSGQVKFLIAKRAPPEKSFPNKWTVPAGKLVRPEYENLPNLLRRTKEGNFCRDTLFYSSKLENPF